MLAGRIVPSRMGRRCCMVPPPLARQRLPPGYGLASSEASSRWRPRPQTRCSHNPRIRGIPRLGPCCDAQPTRWPPRRPAACADATGGMVATPAARWGSRCLPGAPSARRPHPGFRRDRVGWRRGVRRGARRSGHPQSPRPGVAPPRLAAPGWGGRTCGETRGWPPLSAFGRPRRLGLRARARRSSSRCKRGDLGP